MKLHLGCGANVMAGWQNVDAWPSSSAVTLWCAPATLPFGDASIDVVYTEHFVEHLTLVELTATLGELRRVMRPGARLRVSTPDLATIVRDYTKKRTDRWHPVGWRPETLAAMVNEGLREWGHRFVHDFESLTIELDRAGFHAITKCAYRKSEAAELRGLESRPDCGDLIVEAVRT